MDGIHQFIATMDVEDKLPANGRATRHETGVVRSTSG
jgi:hypothetical protein